MVAVIDSVLAGIFAGMLIFVVLGLTTLWATALGVLVFGIGATLLVRHQGRRLVAVEGQLPVLFPSTPAER